MWKRICITATVLASAISASAQNPFVGRWALTIPGDRAGWLGVTQEDGYLDASVLWGGGSVVPSEAVWVDGDTLTVLRIHEVKRTVNGQVARTQQYPELLVATREGDTLKLKQVQPRENGKGVDTREFTGKLIPDLPPAPDLSKVKFGDKVALFDGKDLNAWKLVEEKATNGWKVVDGVMLNDARQEEGKPGKFFGNLRTVDEFTDFNLTLEVRVPKGSNSGVYLRGIYEVQVLDSFGQPLDSHNMGAVYSRIAPSVAAEKPSGEWQALDMTLVDRHVTVKLNGTTIIDNQPVLGCTGGALWSDEFRPGPIYLQGDHGVMEYRNIFIRPVKD